MYQLISKLMIEYIMLLCYCIVLYCIVLGWSLLPNALRPFWDLLCSPNLDTRTWICRLNFFRGLFFQAWGSLTSLKSQSRDPQLKVPPGGLVLMIFMSSKNPSTSVGFAPANLGFRGKHVTLRPPTSNTLSLRSSLNVKTLLHNHIAQLAMLDPSRETKKGK